jgi:hypothetical protein
LWIAVYVYSYTSIPRPVDLDLVRVHGRVGDQDLGVLHSLGLPHPEALVQHKALLEEGVSQGVAGLFQKLERYGRGGGGGYRVEEGESWVRICLCSI